MEGHLEKEVHELHAGLCSALADPKRLMILYSLFEGPRNVNELAEGLDLPQPTTSRHLKILKDRGLVSPVRSGSNIIYSVTDTRLIQALDLLRAVMRDIYEQRAAVAKRSE